MSLLTDIRARISSLIGLSTSQGSGNLYTYDGTAEYRERLRRYEYNWALYRGRVLANLQPEDKTLPTPVNYFRRNLDKVNYFAFGCGVSVTHPRHQDVLASGLKLLGRDPRRMLMRIGQFGSVTGDAFVLVAPQAISDAITAFDASTAKVIATVKTAIRVLVLNPAYCIPVYSDYDPDELLAMHVRVPIRKADNAGWSTTYQHFHIDAESVSTWIGNTSDREEPGTRKSVPNPLGEVYAVHIRNAFDGDSLFGTDDLQDASKLGIEVTNSITSIGSILKYHGDPITCIFGASAKNLKKGPNKIWSGLPREARVENLALNTDLAAANAHLSELRQDLHVMMGVPEIAQGTEQAISNTSAVSLHTMYLPLLERAALKHVNYEPGLLRIIILGIKWLKHYNMLKVRTEDGTERKPDGRRTPLDEDAYEDIRDNTTFVWGSPLPRDEQLQANVQIALVAAGLQSKKGALIVLGEANPDQKLEEIEDDLDAAAKRQQDQFAAAALASAAAAPAGTTGNEPGNGENKGISQEQKGRPKGTTK